MPIPYLHNSTWSNWTREERFFCACLYYHANKHPADFAKWVITRTELDISSEGDWDIGYEVCFYRDYLWQLGGDTAQKKLLPTKRTFDLCLFGEKSIIVIEAKVFEPFKANQNLSFKEDKILIKGLPELESIDVHMVALASSKYFTNAHTYGRKHTLEVFDGHHISWADLAKKYDDETLQQANDLYKAKASQHVPT